MRGLHSGSGDAPNEILMAEAGLPMGEEVVANRPGLLGEDGAEPAAGRADPRARAGHLLDSREAAG